MDKTVLKNFAIESRKELIEKIDRKIKLFYVDEEFKKDDKGDVIVLSNDKHSLTLTKEENSNREKLVQRIKELGYKNVVEEVAYTWFDRIIAIRYMELHDFLPLGVNNDSLGIRVLSSKDNKPIPEIMKFSNLTNSQLSINFNNDKYQSYSNDNDKFKYVLLLICDKLKKVFPAVFDGVTDYIDILIPENILSDSGFITKLLNEIPESNFEEVEVIGWLYQFYISEKKDEVFSDLKKNIKINADTLPAATQLFTPDWIVKYLVENTVGNYFDNKGKLKYRLKNSLNDHIENITEFKFLDPCCGSGHILVYAFEVLYQIYLDNGYTRNDIPELILKNNLFGIDIDERAVQLSTLSVLLKAREYDKSLFNKDVVTNLNIISINNSPSNSAPIDNEKFFEEISYLNTTFKDGKELGSLIKVKNINFDSLEEYFKKEYNILTYDLKLRYEPLIKQNKFLAAKYDVVVTNPPYMGNNSMSSILYNYLKDNYDEEKMDLYTVFIKVCSNLTKDKGYFAMITQQGWLFLPTYLKMREDIFSSSTLINLIHLGPGAFESIGGEVVQSVSFVFKNESNDLFDTLFLKLDAENNKEQAFIQNKNEYIRKISELKNINGFPIAYWLPNTILDLYRTSKTINDVAVTKQGLKSSNDALFFRLWFEVNYNKICRETYPKEERKKYKWFPLSKGGKSRWYGDIDNVINWEDDGRDIKQYAISKYNSVTKTITSIDYYFKKCIAWNQISTTKPNFKSISDGFVFCSASPSLFCNDDIYYYMLGLLNSKISETILRSINPTINFGVGDILKNLYIESKDKKDEIIDIVKQNIDISKNNWDSFETSWDFTKNPLINNEEGLIKTRIIEKLENDKTNYNQLKSNEEKLNQIFNDIYGLNDEIDYHVSDSEMTFKLTTEIDEIRNLINYAVGIMFGRYSLKKEGLNITSSESVINSDDIDKDNIIPLSQNENVYYTDDIVDRFITFISNAFGKENLNQNIEYIAEVLGKKGTESNIDRIRRYFLEEFYDYHCNMYSITGSGKRPIYWLFDSGKKNGFKCLIYIHRYNEQLVSKIRVDYLHKTIDAYERYLEEIDYKLNNESLSVTDKRDLQNKKSDLNAKITECNEYEEKIGNVANKMIKLDLDDGIVNNYAKLIDDNGKSVLAKIK